jgi:hypothetical protein
MMPITMMAFFPSTTNLFSIMSNGTMTRMNDVACGILLRIIGDNPGGHLEDSVHKAFMSKLGEYRDANGSDQSDVIFAIGAAVFGIKFEAMPPPLSLLLLSLLLSSLLSTPAAMTKGNNKDLPIVTWTT